MLRLAVARSQLGPRKEPRQARSRATVEAILEATCRVLVTEGYEAATTNRIAAVAGVSVGSLYQYFPGKEALVAALAQRHIREMLELLQRALIATARQPIEVATRHLVGAMIDAHRLDPALHRVLAEQYGDNHDDVRHDRVAQGMLTTYLAQRRDELRDLDYNLAAFLIVQAVESITHAAVIDQPELLEREDLVDEVTELVVRYLRR